MAEYLAFGVGLGLAAGFSPGPLLALVIAQSVRHGAVEGLRVAAAPLLTDIPIVALSVLATAALAGTSTLQGAISLVGAAFVAYLGFETARSAPPDPERTDAPPPRSWLRGAAVNALSPHPYIFWLAVGAPLLARAWQETPAHGAGFLLGFYGCLVGAKAIVALVVGRSAHLLRGGAYKAVLVLLGLVLLGFAVLLTLDGVALIRGT